MTASGQSSAASGSHPRLSVRLSRLLEDAAGSEGMSLNSLLLRTDGRAIYLVIVFACLPFVVPVSLPGVSTVMGLIVGVLGLRLALGKPPRLPRVLGERVLKPKTVRRILKASVGVLHFLERLVRPRRTRWLAWRWAMLLNGLLIVIMAFLMALPVPPVVLFTNSLPSYAIILIAVSIMEEDGVTIWLGYSAVAVTITYFGFMGGVVVPHLVKWGSELMRTLGGSA